MQFNPQQFTEVYDAYIQGGFYMVFYIAALFCVCAKGSAEMRRTFLYPALFLLAVVYNPFLYEKYIAYFNSPSTYYRYLWLLPVIALLAYYVTKSVFDVKKPIHKAAVLVSFAFIVYLSGAPVTENGAVPLKNSYKYPVEYMEISRSINEDWKNSGYGGTMPIAAAVDGPMQTLRLYDPGLRLPWGRFGINNNFSEAYNLCNNIAGVNGDIFYEQLRTNGLNYIVVTTDNMYLQFLTDAGFKQIGAAGPYGIYKAPEISV